MPEIQFPTKATQDTILQKVSSIEKGTKKIEKRQFIDTVRTIKSTTEFTTCYELIGSASIHELRASGFATSNSGSNYYGNCLFKVYIDGELVYYGKAGPYNTAFGGIYSTKNVEEMTVFPKQELATSGGNNVHLLSPLVFEKSLRIEYMPEVPYAPSNDVIRGGYVIIKYTM